MHKLRFRQVHLDFHTSPAIPGIGGAFDRQEWQEGLKRGHVNSITTFAKCHHGWSYHPTRVGQMHPHLGFDLLRAQFDAAKAIDVNVPIYLSAGVDNVASHEHPEWREVGFDGQYAGWARRVIDPGFHKMCFNSPYMDYLAEQAIEVVRLFPDGDGIFSDIISASPCCCRWCLEVMEKNGLDPTKEDDRRTSAQMALKRYYRVFTEACRIDNPDMPVFHNSGHIPRGRRDLLVHFSHLELESLPTGGWGYDHFPMSARYCQKLELDFLGMTGKFHTTWGEFGGYKHPNALRYECAAMLAHGSKCSVGDQLHPCGRIDASTYAIIGAAYSEVEAKEAWCDDVQSVADIGLVSSEAHGAGDRRENAPDIGAARILLEGHYLFDVLDADMDFSAYRLLILPDDIKAEGGLKAKLEAYVGQGGKLLLTGESNLADGRVIFDCGAACEGPSPCQPDFILPRADLRPSFVDAPMVMYSQNHRVRVTDGESLGDAYDSYFNRTFRHFCSHQHAPNQPQPSGYALGSRKGNVCWIAHPVFSLYRGFGAVAYKEFICNVIDHLLGEDRTLTTNLPSTARLTLQDQARENRYVLHLLYANTINRGGPVHLAGGTVSDNTRSFEVIEELLPLRDIEVMVKPARPIRKVTLEPQGRPCVFTRDGDAVVLRLEEFTCHQMVVLHYADGLRL